MRVVITSLFTIPTRHVRVCMSDKRVTSTPLLFVWFNQTTRVLSMQAPLQNTRKRNVCKCVLLNKHLLRFGFIYMNTLDKLSLQSTRFLFFFF